MALLPRTSVVSLSPFLVLCVPHALIGPHVLIRVLLLFVRVLFPGACG